MKTTLEGINSRIHELEEGISKMEDRLVKLSDTEKQKNEKLGQSTRTQ